MIVGLFALAAAEAVFPFIIGFAIFSVQFAAAT